MATHIAHQPCSFKVQNSSTLGRLGAVTLAASRLVVRIEEAQKLVQLYEMNKRSPSVGIFQFRA